VSGERLVVLRRDGALLGIAAESVAGVERRVDSSGTPSTDRGAGALAIRLTAGGTVAADAVLGHASGVAVRRLAPAVARRLPAGARGLALWGTEPLVVVGAAPTPSAGVRR
jgi:hypothetical protein